MKQFMNIATNTVLKENTCISDFFFFFFFSVFLQLSPSLSALLSSFHEGSYSGS